MYLSLLKDKYINNYYFSFIKNEYQNNVINFNKIFDYYFVDNPLDDGLTNNFKIFIDNIFNNSINNKYNLNYNELKVIDPSYIVYLELLFNNNLKQFNIESYIKHISPYFKLEENSNF